MSMLRLTMIFPIKKPKIKTPISIYVYIIKNPNRLRPHYIWEINKNKENKPKPHIQNILKMENTF